MRCLFVCADDFLWRLGRRPRRCATGPPVAGGAARAARPHPRARGRGPGRPASTVTPCTAAPSAPATSRCWWPWTAGARPACSPPSGGSRRPPRWWCSARRAPEAEPLRRRCRPPRWPAGALEAALERATTRARVQRLREHFAPAERVLILMQDDPDPDAIASALALKTLLGRTKSAATIATFGTITRPENRAMTRILDIDVEQVKPRGAARSTTWSRMVDVQPAFFEEALRRGRPRHRPPSRRSRRCARA